MTIPIKDITDTLATISSYYKSHVGIDLDMEISIDNDDVMAIDCAIKALKELKAHREAWEKILDEMMDVSIPGQDAEYLYQSIYGIIRKYRPKEGDADDQGE